MKKLICLLTAFTVFAGVLTGCGTFSNSGDKLSIVTTIFPEYDWVNHILGDHSENAEVTLLLNNGTDLHSYQPTAEDIVTIAACDVFIYVGGHSDGWVNDVLAQAKNKDMVIINLFETLGDAVKEEEIVEGMEHEHDHDHDDEDHEHEGEHGEGEHGEGEHEDDEHVWLSLENAKIVCSAICKELCILDPDNAEIYTANTESYCQQLSELAAEYRSVVESASHKTLLFGDRFPFRYLVDDYGIEYYAAFSTCSTESKASFETIAFLAGKVDELGLTSVITLKGSDIGIAKTIIDTSSAKNAVILTLDSMQTTTAQDSDNGATYLDIMKSNLQVLKEALK